MMIKNYADKLKVRKILAKLPDDSSKSRFIVELSKRHPKLISTKDANFCYENNFQVTKFELAGEFAKNMGWKQQSIEAYLQSVKIIKGKEDYSSQFPRNPEIFKAHDSLKVLGMNRGILEEILNEAPKRYSNSFYKEHGEIAKKAEEENFYDLSISEYIRSDSPEKVFKIAKNKSVDKKKELLKTIFKYFGGECAYAWEQQQKTISSVKTIAQKSMNELKDPIYYSVLGDYLFEEANIFYNKFGTHSFLTHIDGLVDAHNNYKKSSDSNGQKKVVRNLKDHLEDLEKDNDELKEYKINYEIYTKMKILQLNDNQDEAIKYINKKVEEFGISYVWLDTLKNSKDKKLVEQYNKTLLKNDFISKMNWAESKRDYSKARKYAQKAGFEKEYQLYNEIIQIIK